MHYISAYKLCKHLHHFQWWKNKQAKRTIAKSHEEAFHKKAIADKNNADSADDSIIGIIILNQFNNIFKNKLCILFDPAISFLSTYLQTTPYQKCVCCGIVLW